MSPGLRPRNWNRDEEILALDLYFRDGKRALKASCEALADILNAVPREEVVGASGSRPPRRGSSVVAKLQNFASIDPEKDREGFVNTARLDQTVWDEFAEDPERLRRVAGAIEANLASSESAEKTLGDEVDFVEEAPEGKILTRAHLVRERDPRLRASKKDRVLAETGRLACEGCGMDFGERYGDRGRGFIECHHLQPLSMLAPGHRTRLEDLALLCSNCHRMVHVRDPWLDLQQLVAIQQPYIQSVAKTVS